MISLNSPILSGFSFYLFNVIYALAFLYACYRSPWRKLTSNLGLQHLCFGATVALMIIWSIQANLIDGVKIHFLGMTALTLILGWDLALVCASVVLVGLNVISGDSAANIAANGVITILLPIAVAQIVLHIVSNKLPKNFFIFMFCCGFFCAGLTALLIGCAVAVILGLNDIYTWFKIQQDIVTIIVLTIFPEGLLNGMLLTAIMTFYPDWIRSFDAKKYIDDQ
ncbi:MAG: energy-coupling factor ABC transporter permease [Oceanospirillaceae bacterium]